MAETSAPKTVTVTGGAGFIGSNLVRSLLDSGTAVRVIDNLCEAGDRNLNGLDGPLELPEADIQDADAVRAAIDGSDAVVHLAARSGVAPSVEDPREDFEVNVAGSFNVFDAARLAGTKSVVFASSGAVTAGSDPPLHERMAISPLAPYGASKAYGEAIAHGFSGAYSLRCFVLRFANVYGPLCSHKPSVIPLFLRRALANQSLEVHGQGDQTQDFIHVSDIVAAIRATLSSDKHGTYQLGTGIETSINELTKLVRETVASDVAIESCPSRSGDAARNCVDWNKAGADLGWKPTTPLAEGPSHTANWVASESHRTAG